MVAESTAEALRRSSTRYLWMHNRDWIQMAEEGDPMIAVEGDGVRIIDSEGNSWIDVNGGYNSVNVGYGRQEIADAAYEQMNRLAYFPTARRRSRPRCWLRSWRRSPRVRCRACFRCRAGRRRTKRLSR